jgi:transposase
MDKRADRLLRSASATEVERLQRELRRVDTERDILKKGVVV